MYSSYENVHIYAQRAARGKVSVLVFTPPAERDVFLKADQQLAGAYVFINKHATIFG